MDYLTSGKQSAEAVGRQAIRVPSLIVPLSERRGSGVVGTGDSQERRKGREGHGPSDGQTDGS